MTDDKSNPAPEQDSGEDLDALWSQLMDGAPADDDQDDDPEDDAADEAADAEDDDEGEAADDDDPDDDLEGEAWGDEAGEGDTEDPWATLPDEARSEYERLRQYERSNEGRIAAYQREIAALQERLAQAAGSDADVEVPEQFRELVDDYPDIAKPFVKTITSLERKIEQMEADAAYGRQQMLEESVPGGLDLVAKNADRFRAWLEDQPRAIRMAAQQNATRIVDPKGAAMVISAFRQSIEGNSARQPADDQQTRLDRRRKRQKAASTVMKSRPGMRTSERPSRSDDSDAAFDWAVAKVTGKG